MNHRPCCRKANQIPRRDALKLGAAGVAAGALALGPTRVLGGEGGAGSVFPVGAPGHVVQVRLPGMRTGLHPHPEAARIAVEKAVTTLAGETDPGRAWLRFVGPEDRVGIKVNCLGTRVSSTMREVTEAIADGVRAAGVPDANIVIIDMFASNMMGGRYEQRTNPRKMRVLAHKEGNYHKGWEKTGPARARFADIFMWTTAIINVPPIKDHDLAGVTCAMKNMTFGVVEKPHLNHATINESIPLLWALEQIRSRVRLTIADGSFCLFDGGPKHNPRAHTTHDSIYATCDPVAMDAVAHELIESLRAENGLRTLAAVGRPPNYIEYAAELGLGLADRQRIRLQTVELPRFEPPA